MKYFSIDEMDVDELLAHMRQLEIGPEGFDDALIEFEELTGVEVFIVSEEASLGMYNLRDEKMEELRKATDLDLNEESLMLDVLRALNKKGAN